VSSASHGPRPKLYGLVALGSSIGALARWGIGDVMTASANGWPWPTLAVNVAGSFLIGALAALVARHRGPLAGLPAQLLLTIGFCGSFTTFSAFSLEVLLIFQAGRPALALSYVVASVILWLVAAWAGYAAGRQGR